MAAGGGAAGAQAEGCPAAPLGTQQPLSPRRRHRSRPQPPPPPAVHAGWFARPPPRLLSGCGCHNRGHSPTSCDHRDSITALVVARSRQPRQARRSHAAGKRGRSAAEHPPASAAAYSPTPASTESSIASSLSADAPEVKESVTTVSPRYPVVVGVGGWEEQRVVWAEGAGRAVSELQQPLSPTRLHHSPPPPPVNRLPAASPHACEEERCGLTPMCARLCAAAAGRRDASGGAARGRAAWWRATRWRRRQRRRNGTPPGSRCG
jgi:hypothetical protein